MKKISALILCLCLFLLFPVTSAQAAELNSFLTFHEVITDAGQSSLRIYGMALPKDGELTLSIDSQKISDAVLSTVRQEKLPTTVYCLVDISTRMTKQQIQQQEDILNIISSRMGEGDSMVITTVGSKTTEGAILDTLEARKTAISTLKRDGNRVDMYQAIVDAMTSLEQKTTYCVNRSLLILSDGLVAESGVTEQQAIDAVSATSIPVYAIGITGDADSSYFVENARHMLNMADASMGGIGIIPAKERISAADAAQQVWENIQEGAVIKVDLETVTSRSNSATVRATYTLPDSRLEDSITVDLTAIPMPAEETTVETVSATEEPSPKNEGISYWIQENRIAVGVGAAVVVLLIAALVVLSIRNRKKQAAQAQLEAENESAEAIHSAPQNASGVDTILPTSDFEGATDPYPPTKPEPSLGSVNVQMTVTTHQNVSIRFTLQTHKPQVLGRDDRADIIVNAEDYQLSGKHCVVEWDGSYLYIQDMGSTNGTVLNGVSLKPNAWNRLNNNAVVHMGSFDYQVFIDN